MSFIYIIFAKLEKSSIRSLFIIYYYEKVSGIIAPCMQLQPL